MVSNNAELLKKFCIRLYEINALKFGDFEMKVGLRSPIYFDLRVIISYPDVMVLLTQLLSEFMKERNLDYVSVCGVPYTALPIATMISVQDNKPMLIRRKETKSYGTKKLIEGIFKVGEKCLIIEDVVTSGTSILETVDDLQKEGIVVNDAVIILDREQGGAINLKNHGINVHSLITLSELLKTLHEAGKIEADVIEKVTKYITNNRVKEKVKECTRIKLPYELRADQIKSVIGKELLNKISAKKTNLCLAADLTNTADLLYIADLVGPYICIFKTHVDIIDDFNEDFINSLTALAKKHNFLIWEDRKFADIGSTVALQYTSGIFHISRWAHIVTVHSLTGPSILEGLKSSLAGSQEPRGVFLLAEISSADNLISSQYTESTSKLASNNLDIVAGIVCQQRDVIIDTGLLQITPGCKIDDVSDDLGQQYNTPEFVVNEKGADIAVVGRGIIKAKNVEDAAKLYRDRLWNAYCDRVGTVNDKY